MKGATELYQLLKSINDDGVENIFPATVVSVDKENNVCVVKIDEMEIADVRLRATINEGGEGFVIYPKQESIVLVERIVEGTFCICMYNEVDECSLKVETVEMAVDADGFLIKKGVDTLKDTLILMIEAVQKIVVLQGTNPDYAKLIQAKTKVNNLLK